jgi:hypothetical protein
MKSPAGYLTKQGLDKDKAHRHFSGDYNNNYKRTIGVIRKIDVNNTKDLYIHADVVDGNGTFIPFGNNKTPIIVADSPLDLLQRFGGIAVGQTVEIFYRGIGPTTTAYAHIIGDVEEPLVQAQQIPSSEVKQASSLPFEPTGIL